uniref:Uncharacterized protein n=1 Tax=Pectobacterium carotovorum TaxID=554 RepID=A0A0N9NLR2_PECCA|nr:hypothetical protein [Pectobacterium carotovorum]ALG88741.1 hypothetical protein Drgb6_00011 [Pectobacterium carotovorum]
MNKNNSLFDYLLDNWALPLKTVSFWVISLFLITLRDEIRNNTSFNDIIGFDVTNYILFILILITYLFSNYIDNFILSFLKRNKPEIIDDKEWKKEIENQKILESDPWKGKSIPINTSRIIVFMLILIPAVVIFGLITAFI